MSRPRLKGDLDPLPGLAAVALFVVMAASFLSVDFPEAAGFGADANVTASIGAALFDIQPSAVAGPGAVPSEGFLIAFEIIDVVLVAALVGSIMLARRDQGGDGS